MDSRNIYDMFRENVELKRLIDRYHRVLKQKDKYTNELEDRIKAQDILIRMYEEPKEFLLKEKK